MSHAPVLLVGGSGVVGRRTAQYLRAACPDLPLLIGARNAARASEVAREVGNAEEVILDLNAPDLGLGDRPVSAVAIFFKDDNIVSLQFALSRRVPHISISSGASETGPDMAAWMQQPVAPVVLGAEWLVGSVTIPTLEFAKAFSRVDDITIGALLDEQDTGGPATDIDMHRLGEVMPAALTRTNGKFHWRMEEENAARLYAIDGTEHQAVAFSPFDVMGLAVATGAPNVQFNLATGITSSRRRGEPMSTEIIIELAGLDKRGAPLRTRHAVFHPHGQMPLTSLGVAMVIERLIGAASQPAPPPGLFFPYQLLDPTAWYARLEAMGGKVIALDVRSSSQDR